MEPLLQTSRLVAALQHRRPTVRVLAQVAVLKLERSLIIDRERPTVSERPFLVFLPTQRWLTVLLLLFFFSTPKHINIKVTRNVFICATCELWQ